jgi:hypothetical protein
VGGAILLKATTTSDIALFLLGFYLLLVGSKMAVAIATEKSRKFLSSRGYLITVRLLGAAMALFAALFVRDAMRFLF